MMEYNGDAISDSEWFAAEDADIEDVCEGCNARGVDLTTCEECNDEFCTQCIHWSAGEWLCAACDD